MKTSARNCLETEPSREPVIDIAPLQGFSGTGLFAGRPFPVKCERLCPADGTEHTDAIMGILLLSAILMQCIKLFS